MTVSPRALILLLACVILATGCTVQEAPTELPAATGIPAETTAQPASPTTITTVTTPAPQATLTTIATRATATPAITGTTPALPTSSKTATTVTTPAKTYPRPSTGALIAGKRILGGYGRLKIDNVNGTKDSVAILTRWHSTTPLLGVFIRHGDTHTNENIPDGMYDLYILSGENWDAEREQFDDSVEYLLFDTPLTFKSSEKWVVILYPMEDEDAEGELVPVPQKDFPDL